jgi:hypothetical protein
MFILFSDKYFINFWSSKWYWKMKTGLLWYVLVYFVVIVLIFFNNHQITVGSWRRQQLKDLSRKLNIILSGQKRRWSISLHPMPGNYNVYLLWFVCLLFTPPLLGVGSFMVFLIWQAILLSVCKTEQWNVGEKLSPVDTVPGYQYLFCFLFLFPSF